MMGSRDCRAAAACSPPAISPVPSHDVPDAGDEDCEPDARQITPKGLHVLCPYCPYSRTPKYWARTDHFHAHMRVDHPDEPIPDPDGYTCPCHGRPFAARWEMTRHIIGKSRATCPHCGRGVARASFRRHVGNCRHNAFPPEKHGCDTCGRFFLSALGTRATVAQPATPKQTHRRSKETCANRTRYTTPPRRIENECGCTPMMRTPHAAASSRNKPLFRLPYATGTATVGPLADPYPMPDLSHQTFLPTSRRSASAPVRGMLTNPSVPADTTGCLLLPAP